MDIETVGKAIASRRKASGITQDQLARRAGVSRATIGALEGLVQRELGLNKIVAILNVLKLDLYLSEANSGRPTLEDLQREAGE